MPLRSKISEPFGNKSLPYKIYTSETSF